MIDRSNPDAGAGVLLLNKKPAVARRFLILGKASPAQCGAAPRLDTSTFTPGPWVELSAMR